MDECSGKVQKTSAHAENLIVVYLAVVEIHRAAPNEKASALPNKKGRECQDNFIQRGDGRTFREGSDGKRVLQAAQTRERERERERSDRSEKLHPTG